MAILLTFSTKSNHKGGRGGGQKTPNLGYVIHGCSLSKSRLEGPFVELGFKGNLYFFKSRQRCLKVKFSDD